ncbi:hypothetical protein GO986_08635 [Deinococcus sp. HMF7620]|uniref:Terminase n=1 Tax=Deinococcus arboris TaxID=2682977 RepID=A0A7C9HY95_9DEIO|nr:hypothetical protein [Deinococcus arboris]MVN86828.1 hypothetical protein [Deinococcus arboris]
MNDTPAASGTEPVLAASPFSRGLQAGLNQTIAKPKQTEAENPFLRYQNDPVGFATEVLGLTIWDAMKRILTAVVTSRRVSVRSGHKVSKSTTAAVIGLWRVYCRPDSRTVLSAPTSRQVRIIIWKEVRRLHSKARLPGRMPLDPGSGFVHGESELFGFSTDEPEKMAGVSGADLQFIIDEASGVDEGIFEAIEGNLAGGASLLLISNPTQVSGTFYDSHTTKRHLWNTIHISSEDTPNVISGEILIPGLATRDWVQEKKLDWGEDSPLFQVRVRGNFPTQAENTVIGLGLVEAARARFDAQDQGPTGAFTLGVDVARFGDDSTVLQPLFGKQPIAPRVHAKQDNVEVAGHVMDFVEELRATHDYPVTAGPVRVKIDDLGNGSGVTDHLRHSKRARELGLTILPITVSEAATSEGYSKLRDQLWFALRNWLKEGGQLPPDSHLEGELVAVKYSFDAQGRSKVEKKEDLKKRMGRSPDRADALALAIYDPPAIEKPTATGMHAVAKAALRAAERAADTTTRTTLAARRAALARRR